MKKYLLIILTLFSAIVMANDDFKASVTVGYGTNDSVYKGREYYRIPIFMNTSYKNLYLEGTEIGAKFIDTDRFDTSVFLELQDGHYIKPSKMESGYRNIKKRKFIKEIDIDTPYKEVKKYYENIPV